jgi:hypothetical protein
VAENDPLLRRAPWPHKPTKEIARSLRETLTSSWWHARQGRTDRARLVLEFAVLHAICDLEAWTVTEWETIRDELLQARRSQ